MHNRQVLWLAWALCALFSFAIGLSGAGLFGIGSDPDDMMRYVQLRDLMEGGDWFDLHQARLGVAGTDIHWSRLADLPYLLVAWPLKPFLGTHGALMFAGTLVPPLLSGLFALGLLRGMRALSGDRGMRLPWIAAGVVGLHVLVFAPRFSAGAFDHHHLQIGLLAVAVGYSLTARPRRWDGILAALACAASITIGAESVQVIIAICALWALRWVVETERRAASADFGLTLGTAAVLGLLFTDFDAWTSVVCDAYGLPMAGLLAIGGFGLWGLVRLDGAGRLASPRARLMSLLGLGAVAAIALFAGAPECAANPMNAMPVEVREGWLARIGEAKPLLGGSLGLGFLLSKTGTTVVAMMLGMLMAWRTQGTERRSWVILTALVGVAFAFTFMQVRFYTFASVLAAFIMATLLLRALSWTQRADGGEVSPLLRLPLVLLLLAGSSSATFYILGERISPTGSPLSESYASCDAEGTVAALDGAIPGRVWTRLDDGPRILAETGHGVFAANYHRGWRDISDWLTIGAMPPAEGVMMLRERGVDYVLICEGGFSEHVYGEGYPEGLLATLSAGTPAPGLTPVTHGGDPVYALYRVSP